MVMDFIRSLFVQDSLSLLMFCLIVTVVFIVGSFSSRYLRGDSRYTHFFLVLPFLVSSMVCMVTADNLILLFMSWTLNNLLLVRLMVHKAEWRAAQASGQLAAKILGSGSLAIGVAFLCFYLSTGTSSIHSIIHVSGADYYREVALVLLLVGAMMQSGVWPFHKWLTSSLNSPTPVSALMHAGLINAGGFLLARFAPLYLKSSSLLQVMFIAGICTAIIGTLWKLVQNDIKRMLACSTMAQMGFMLAQCGLGLFSAALAHLFWHGMFKANLFLGAGSAAQEIRYDHHSPSSVTGFLSAVLIAAAGTSLFIVISDADWPHMNSRLVLFAAVLMAQTQLVLPILIDNSLVSKVKGLLAVSLVGSVHGASILAVETLVAPLGITEPQPLSNLHEAGIFVLAVAWIWMIFEKGSPADKCPSQAMLRLYVRALNGSQPHPATITVHRNHYRI